MRLETRFPKTKKTEDRMDSIYIHVKRTNTIKYLNRYTFFLYHDNIISSPISVFPALHSCQLSNPMAEVASTCLINGYTC